jgi:hypothetical protein
MKKKTQTIPAVKAENKNVVAGTPAATKSEAVTPAAAAGTPEALRSDLTRLNFSSDPVGVSKNYIQSVKLWGIDHDSEAYVEINAYISPDCEISDPVELEFTEFDYKKNSKNPNKAYLASLTLESARLFRDAFAEAVAFAEGRPLGKAASRRDALLNHDEVSIDQDILLSLGNEYYNYDITVRTFDKEGFSHRIEHKYQKNGRDEVSGFFELSHADMRKFHAAIGRAIEFFEVENGMAPSVPAGNCTPSARASKAGGDTVALPRELVEDLAKDVFNYIEGYIFCKNRDNVSVSRAITSRLTFLNNKSDEALVSEFEDLKYFAYSYVTMMKVLGRGEGLLDVDALVTRLDSQRAAKAGAAKK